MAPQRQEADPAQLPRVQLQFDGEPRAGQDGIQLLYRLLEQLHPVVRDSQIIVSRRVVPGNLILDPVAELLDERAEVDPLVALNRGDRIIAHGHPGASRLQHTLHGFAGRLRDPLRARHAHFSEAREPAARGAAIGIDVEHLKESFQGLFHHARLDPGIAELLEVVNLRGGILQLARDLHQTPEHHRLQRHFVRGPVVEPAGLGPLSRPVGRFRLIDEWAKRDGRRPGSFIGVELRAPPPESGASLPAESETRVTDGLDTPGISSADSGEVNHDDPAPISLDPIEPSALSTAPGSVRSAWSSASRSQILSSSSLEPRRQPFDLRSIVAGRPVACRTISAARPVRPMAGGFNCRSPDREMLDQERRWLRWRFAKGSAGVAV